MYLEFGPWYVPLGNSVTVVQRLEARIPAGPPLTASLDVFLWLGIFLPHLRDKKLLVGKGLRCGSAGYRRQPVLNSMHSDLMLFSHHSEHAFSTSTASPTQLLSWLPAV